MTLDEIRQQFSEARIGLQRHLVECRSITQDHCHTWFCFPWSWCRINERQVRKLEIQTRELYLAELALARDDLQPALTLVNAKIAETYESNLAIAHRWSRLPELTMKTVLCDPVAQWKYFCHLRDALVRLGAR
jgi:hypothetical protein